MPLSSARPESRWRRWTSRLDPALLMLLVGPLMICFAWIVTLSQITKDRNRALAEGYREANGLSRSFAEQAQHRLDDIDQMVRIVRAAYVAGDGKVDITRLLATAGFAEPQKMKLGVLDASNRLVAGEVPDAPEWLARVLPRGNALVDRPSISTPLLANGIHPDTLALSRPIRRQDGSFAGTVVASVRPQQILSNLRKLNVGPMARQFGSVELGRDDIAAVLGLDGRVRAALLGGRPIAADQWPAAPVIVRMANGDIQRVPDARIDAEPRVWSGGYLRDYQLIMVVGMSYREVLRDFRRHRGIYLVGTSAFTLGVGLLTLFAAILARRQRRTLQRLAETERQANELKSSFLARISHDLRTPLNGILGFSELVKTTSGEPEQRQYGEYIHNSASHLLDLVNMILDLTKLRNGTLQLQLRDIDLRQVATNVSRTHTIVAKSKGLEFRLGIAEGFPDAVVCDGVRVREVMNNLLHNAVKFTQAGHVALDLFAERDRAMVRVSDTGIGMSDEVKSHLFEPFSEGRDEASMAMAGAGLGLAFSRELVALHGGGIEVTSQQGEGTSATFWLPVGGPASGSNETALGAIKEGASHATRTDRG